MNAMNKEQDDSKIENGGVFHFVSPFQGDQARTFLCMLFILCQL